MKSRASIKFWRHYHQLPPQVQRLADKSYRLWIADHWHPSLHFKKVKNYWVARVSEDYRALGIEAEGTITCFWIGSHHEYERLLAS